MWQVQPPAPKETLEALGNPHPLAGQLLYNRGIVDRAQARAFLTRSTERWPDPYLLPDMDRAVDRLDQALRREEKVVVYGDFDADGITGTALLVRGLRDLGVNAHPYIPHRDREGYGLNNAALEALHAQGARLVISVDTGTSAVDEITHAVTLGLDMIALDHHAIPPHLPPATAIVNPHRPESRYPFRGLSGVGVAFKFLQACRSGGRQLSPVPGKPTEAPEANLDLVAIGTVADLAPLQEENRWIVQCGLDILNHSPRPGLSALLQRAGLEKGAVEAADLGYAIAPRINAMGRLEHAITSYQLLSTQDPREAAALAEQLEETNRARRQLTQDTMELAQRALASSQRQDSPLVMVAGVEYPAGIIGLVASQLAEEWHRPAVVVEQGPEFSRGSARSIPGFSIIEALRQCSDLMVRFGGHPQAAGFTIETARLPELHARLSEVSARELAGLDLQPTLCIDAATPLRNLPGQVMTLLRRLGPFGMGNPEPLFLTKGLPVVQSRTMGAGKHLELKLKEGNMTWRAVGFGMGERMVEVGGMVDVVYTVQVDRWQGEDVLQLHLRDFRPTGSQS